MMKWFYFKLIQFNFTNSYQEFKRCLPNHSSVESGKCSNRSSPILLSSPPNLVAGPMLSCDLDDTEPLIQRKVDIC